MSSIVSGGYQERLIPFGCYHNQSCAELSNGMLKFFKSDATTTGSHIIEITYISSKKKRRGISGKKIRYCLRYRAGIAK